MNRLPVDRRRDQLVQAALAVAIRDGLERTTVRAVAAQAGVSLGVLHYAFADKAEMLRSMAAAITAASLSDALAAVQLPDHAELLDPTQLVPAVVDAFVRMVVATPGEQLLSAEIAIAAQRDPNLAGVAATQLANRIASIEQFLVTGTLGTALRWTLPSRLVARRVLVCVDGAINAWLVDRDDDLLRGELLELGIWLRAHATTAVAQVGAAPPVP